MFLQPNPDEIGPFETLDTTVGEPVSATASEHRKLTARRIMDWITFEDILAESGLTVGDMQFENVNPPSQQQHQQSNNKGVKRWQDTSSVSHQPKYSRLSEIPHHHQQHCLESFQQQQQQLPVIKSIRRITNMNNVPVVPVHTFQITQHDEQTREQQSHFNLNFKRKHCHCY